MLRKLNKFMEQKRIIINDFYSLDKYLKPGMYYFDNKITCLYLKNDFNTEHNLRLFEKKTYSNILYDIIIYFLRKTIYRNSYKITKKQSFSSYEKFAGTLFLPANNNSKKKDVRIFNFNESTVLTIYKEEERFYHKLNTYNFFKTNFPIPKIQYYNNKDFIFIEEFIDYKPKIKWTDNEMNYVSETIFKTYLSYFKECTYKNNYYIKRYGDIIDELRLDKFYIKFMDMFTEYSKETLDGLLLPFVKLNGDMWFYNVLLSKENNCYFIDWEHSDYYMILYDFFWFMYYEASYNNDYTFIYNYCLGKYDDIFNQSLKEFGCDYYNEKKVLYFICFILNIIASRFPKSTEHMKNYLYNQLTDLTKYIKLNIKT